MTPWIYGIAGAALVSGFAGWTVRDWKADSDELKAADAAQARYEAAVDELSARSLAYEELAQSIRQSERTDRLEIREIYRDVEVPSDCAVPDDVASVLDSAVDRANAARTGQPVSAVPEASEAPEAID